MDYEARANEAVSLKQLAELAFGQLRVLECCERIPELVNENAIGYALVLRLRVPFAT